MGVYTTLSRTARVGGTVQVSGTNPRFSISGSAPALPRFVAVITNKCRNYIIPLTVLLAHNGFAYDFPLLLAEIEHRPQYLRKQDFVTYNVHFAEPPILASGDAL